MVPFNATKFKKYLISGQVHDNINFEVMKYIRLPIFFLNISTKSAYIPAKLCNVRVIYLNTINMLNPYTTVPLQRKDF